jgi:hypothetical protein
MSVSPKEALTNWAAMVALWTPVFLELLDHFGPKSEGRSDALQWALFIIGAMGMGSVLYTCWKDTRHPAWRAAHGLAPIRSSVASR